MIIIEESDLGIPCDSPKCTAQAVYAVTIKTTNTTVRLFCPECTEHLVGGMAKALRDNKSSEHVHDYIETEFIGKGGAISA